MTELIMNKRAAKGRYIKYRPYLDDVLYCERYGALRVHAL